MPDLSRDGLKGQALDTTCPSCDKPMASAAKFCSECGQPVVAGEAGLTPLRLSGRDGARQTMSEGAVTRGGSVQLLGAIAVAVALALALLLAVSRDGDDAASPDRDEQTDSPSSAQSEEDLTEATESAEGNGIETVTLAEAADGSDLGTILSGYQLLAVGRGHLLTIDPAGDSLREVELAGEPIGVAGRELILFRPAEGFVAVDIDAPSAEPRMVVDLDDLAAVETSAQVQRPQAAALRSHGTLLIEYSISPLGSINAQSIVYEVDIATGEFARTELAVGQATWWFGHGRLGLAWVPGAGLFDGLGGQTRKISDGFPVVSSADFVVIYECSSPGDCNVAWIDRHTDQQVDRTLPSIDDLWWNSVEVGNGGRVLLVEGANKPRYFDLDRGRWLPTEVNQAQEGMTQSSRFGLRPEAVSGDGRWLAIPNTSGLALYDLDNDTFTEVDIAGLTRGQRLFFIEA